MSYIISLKYRPDESDGIVTHYLDYVYSDGSRVTVGIWKEGNIIHRWSRYDCPDGSGHESLDGELLGEWPSKAEEDWYWSQFRDSDPPEDWWDED